MATLVYTSMSAFTLGSVSYVSDVKRFTHTTNPIFEEGGGFTSAYKKGVLTKLEESFTFDLQMSNTLNTDPTDGAGEDIGLEQTSLCVSAFSFAGTNYLAYLESMSVNITSVSKEAKAVASLRHYPVRTSIDISGSFVLYMDSTFATQLFTQGQSDQNTLATVMSATSEFYHPLAFTVTDPGGAAQLNYSGNVTVTPQLDVVHDDLQKITINWSNRGNPTTQAGTGIIGTILTDSAQPLIDYSFRTATLSGNDTATGTGTGFLRSLGITIPNSGIITMNGDVAIVAEPTWGS